MKGADFTEQEYVRLLKMAVEKYRFCNYGDTGGEPLTVWRHDIDYSPNRGRALARIEAEAGVSCVYHVLLTSRYYSVFEPETLECLREIVRLGHSIGLHFDMDVFSPDSAESETGIIARIKFEKSILEQLLDTRLLSMSFHNTVLNSQRVVRSSTIAAMVNVNADDVFRSYKYVSDSNGMWRRERLEDVLNQNPYPRLHVLTHPVWWTPDAMNPADRLRRAIDGRARSGLEVYFDLLHRDGRAGEVISRSGFDPSAKKSD